MKDMRKNVKHYLLLLVISINNISGEVQGNYHDNSFFADQAEARGLLSSGMNVSSFLIADTTARQTNSMDVNIADWKPVYESCMHFGKMRSAYIGLVAGFSIGLFSDTFYSYKYYGQHANDVSLILGTLIGGSIGWWIGGIVSEEGCAKCCK